VVNVTARHALQTFPPAIYIIVFAVCIVYHVSGAADVGCEGVFIETYLNDGASTFSKKRFAMARPYRHCRR
jgi:hypothetical protein